MDLPKSLYTNTVKEKEVFYFESDKISSTEPHYFICIKKKINEVLLFTCGTTQKEKRERYLNLQGISLHTLVPIKPDGKNGLKQETWIDCNSFIPYTIEEFKALCDSGKIEFKGEVADDTYKKIIIGMHISPKIAEEDKEHLPSPENL